MIKKTISITVFIIILSLNANAQKFALEPGFVLGTSYYMGDINHTRQFYSPGLLFGAVIRHPVNNFYALKLSLLRGKISGNDADFGSIYQNIRGHSFSNTLYEVSLQYEINFLSFNSNIKKDKTPYITAGLGIVIADGGVFSPVIPLGIGYKFVPLKKMTISAEWSFRNTFTDSLDLLEQQSNTQKQVTKIKNNDWYSVAALTLTYNISPEKKWCPAYDKKRKYH